MVLITKSSLEEGTKERKSIHPPAGAARYILIEKNGEKVVQVDTYRSSDRACNSGVKQTIQLDKAAIDVLYNALNR